MTRARLLKPNKTFRENARFVVPALFDEFLTNKDRVIGHPRLKKELHRMRLKGKTVRYAMEIFSPAFGDEFSACLEEVKTLLGILGHIHDCDVNIPKLEAHLQTIRLFNGIATKSSSLGKQHQRIATRDIRGIIAEQKQTRRTLFLTLEQTVNRWTVEDFRTKILLATV